MDDTQIIQLYLARKESAIEETERKYGHYLNQVIYNILRCREDTEEVTEDTYFAVWNSIPPAIPVVFKHFLSRIARNLAFGRLDYLTAKRRDNHLVVLLSELEDCIPTRSGNPEETLEAKQIGILLNQFLETLGQQDCRIFLCRYFYSMTIREISEKYQLPQRKIKYRLNCLRKQLRTELDKEGITI